MRRPSHQTSIAFTRRELLVVLAALALVFGFSLLWPKKRKIVEGRVNCVSNLKQIGLALRMWSGDHAERFPMAVSTNRGGSLEFIEMGDAAGHFRAASNELNSPKVLACSEDRERRGVANFADFSGENLSYFVALDAEETRPEMILAGERTFTPNGRIVSGVITVSREIKVTFARGVHQGYGNIALADGSAQRMENRDLSSQAVRSPVSPFRVQIP